MARRSRVEEVVDVRLAFAVLLEDEALDLGVTLFAPSLHGSPPFDHRICVSFKKLPFGLEVSVGLFAIQGFKSNSRANGGRNGKGAAICLNR